MEDSEAAAGGLPILSVQGSAEVDAVFGGILDTHGYALRFVQRENIGVVVRIFFDRFPGEDLVATRRNAAKKEPAFHIRCCTFVQIQSLARLVRDEHDLHALRGLIQRVANSAFDLAAARTQNHVQRSGCRTGDLPDTIQDVCALVDRFTGVEGHAFGDMNENAVVSGQHAGNRRRTIGFDLRGTGLHKAAGGGPESDFDFIEVTSDRRWVTLNVQSHWHCDTAAQRQDHVV